MKTLAVAAELATADPGVDEKATEEAKQLASGKSPNKLADEAAAAEHHRDQAFRNNFEIIAIIVLWALALQLLALSLVWTTQIIAPEGVPYLHWLNDRQMDKLQDVLTGGLLVALLTDHFRKRLR